MSFFEKFRPKFTPPEPTGKVIKMWEHKGWGNKISIFDWDKQKLTGHLPFSLQIGDTVLVRMKSGRIGELRILYVERVIDPPDMFFANFYSVGYVDD